MGSGMNKMAMIGRSIGLVVVVISGLLLAQPVSAQLVTYTYDDPAVTDGKGRLTSVVDPSGTTKFFYNNMGRTSKTDKIVDATTYTTQTTYDLAGRVETVTYPDTSIITYTYNGPLLSQVKEGATVHAAYAGFSALGQAGSVTYVNGVVTTYTYSNSANGTCPSNNFRICTTVTTKGASTYQNLRYSYDAGGNITAITDNLNAANNQTFTYDGIDRLVTAQATVYGTISYTYDEVGNMLSNSQVGSYTYPTSGPTSVRPHAVTTAGANSYVYDKNGNMTSGAGRTISYDPSNRPTTITASSQTTTLLYDGDGGRVKKTVAGVTTTYIGKLYECTAAACSKYIFAGSARIAINQTASGTTFYYHTDHLGSSSVITDQAGTKVQDLAYYPFGQTRLNSGSANVKHKYTGQELDDSTGLYFYNARYYDPILARFIQADTVVPSPFDPQTVNRYSYVQNNPLVYTDPTGHGFFTKIRKWVKEHPDPVGYIMIGAGLVIGIGGELLGCAGPCATVGAILIANGVALVNGDPLPGGTVGFNCTSEGVCTGTVGLDPEHSAEVGPPLINIPGLRDGPPILGTVNLDTSTVTLFVGGILTTRETQEEYARQVGAALAVNNTTGGLFYDLFEALFLKLTMGGSNQSVRALANLVAALTSDEFRMEVRIIAHSEGAIIASNALSLAMKEGADLKKVTVITYGGAAWTFPGGVSVTHIANPFDPVSGFFGRGNFVGGVIGTVTGYGFYQHLFPNYR